MKSMSKPSNNGDIGRPSPTAPQARTPPPSTTNRTYLEATASPWETWSPLTYKSRGSRAGGRRHRSSPTYGPKHTPWPPTTKSR